MNLSKIKHQLSKAEKEYNFWQSAVKCYEKYVSQPYPDNHIDLIYVAYLLNNNATVTSKVLNNKGVKTIMNRKISASYITQMIDTYASSDKQLTSTVRRLLKLYRTKAKPLYKNNA